MPLIFYPATDIMLGSLSEKIILLSEAAISLKKKSEEISQKRTVPREINTSYNWQEIAKVLREIRELPEVNAQEKQIKSKLLLSLAEVYSVLSEGKMAKLEAVRLALISEANYA